MALDQDSNLRLALIPFKMSGYGGGYNAIDATQAYDAERNGQQDRHPATLRPWPRPIGPGASSRPRTTPAV